MAQNISIHRITESGKILEFCKVNFAPLNSLLYKVRDFKKKYPLLSYIDEYGDTYFNHLQIPDLIKELEEFRKEIKKKPKFTWEVAAYKGKTVSRVIKGEITNTIEDVNEIIAFLRHTQEVDSPRPYIKFQGD